MSSEIPTHPSQATSIEIVSSPHSPNTADSSLVPQPSQPLSGIDLTSSQPRVTVPTVAPDYDLSDMAKIPPTAFAEMPLHILIGLSPAGMTVEQKRAYVAQLQELRKAPQTLMQRQRKDDVDLEAKSTVKTRRGKSTKAANQAPVDVNQFL